MRIGCYIVGTLALVAASPASAAIILNAGNVAGSLETVHLTGNQSANVVLGDVAGNVALYITGTEAIVPSSTGMGQAWIAATDGGLNSLTFALASGYTFDAIEFNLNPPNGRPVPYTVTFGGSGPNGTNTQVFDLDGGNSFFNAYTTEGWSLTSVTFSSTEALAGVGQIRIGGVQQQLTPGTQSAVPEPASWAMMVGGFGLIGGAMRRRQRTNLHFA